MQNFRPWICVLHDFCVCVFFPLAHSLIDIKTQQMAKLLLSNLHTAT